MLPARRGHVRQPHGARPDGRHINDAASARRGHALHVAGSACAGEAQPHGARPDGRPVHDAAGVRRARALHVAGCAGAGEVATRRQAPRPPCQWRCMATHYTRCAEGGAGAGGASCRAHQCTLDVCGLGCVTSVIHHMALTVLYMPESKGVNDDITSGTGLFDENARLMA